MGVCRYEEPWPGPESDAPCRGASRGDDCERARRNSWVTGRSGLCVLSILGWRGEIGRAGEAGRRKRSKRPRSHIRWLAVSPAEDQNQVESAGWHPVESVCRVCPA